MKKILFLGIFLLIVSFAASLIADTEDTYAYKLALLYTRQLQSSEALTNPSLAPENSTVAEFKWLLESLKNRFQDSEETIATTIMQTWRYLKKDGQKMSLLDVTRSLNKFSQDKRTFASGKINFHEAANRWIIQNRGKK